MTAAIQFEFVNPEYLATPSQRGPLKKDCPRRGAIHFKFCTETDKERFVNEFASQFFPEKDYRELPMPSPYYLVVLTSSDDQASRINDVLFRMGKIFASNHFKARLKENKRSPKYFHRMTSKQD